jgi:hypothetical protein
MSSFLFNLAQRGAGLASIVAVQPVATPYFAADLRTALMTQPDDALVGETASEIPPSDATASTQQAPLVDKPDPQHPEQPPPSRSRADIPTAHEREPWSRELNRPEPRSDSVLNPKRISQPATTPVYSRSEEPLPSGPMAGSEVEAELTESPAPIRVMPLIQEMPRTQEAPTSEAEASGPPDASVADTAPSGRTSDSRTRLLTRRLIPAEPADQSRTLPGASDKVETVPAATPAISQPPATKQPIRQSSTSTLLGKPSGTPSVPQPIQVRIGTVEVRATTPPAAPPPAPQPAQGPSGFDGYTMIRSYMSWERH